MKKIYLIKLSVVFYEMFILFFHLAFSQVYNDNSISQTRNKIRILNKLVLFYSQFNFVKYVYVILLNNNTQILLNLMVC